MDKKTRQPMLDGFDEPEGPVAEDSLPGDSLPEEPRQRDDVMSELPKGSDGSADTRSASGPPAADGRPLERSDRATDSAEGLPNLQGKRVFVIDSHALIYQVFHALQDMTGPAGQPAGAIFGFVRDMIDMLARKSPDYLICAFDSPGKTFRHDLFEPYKANRSEMPLDLQSQIPNIRRFLHAMGIPVLAREGYEADDILATVAALTERLGGECFLVTADKDCRQLIGDRVAMYNIRKDQVIDAQFVLDDWGIRPDQAVDFQALWGDSTDNIPGVPGVGKKTAGELLAKYGTLEAIYEHVDELSGAKRQQNIRQNHDAALLSRELVRLDADVPIDLDWSAAETGGMDTEALLALCSEFGFRQLAQRMAGVTVAAAPVEWEAQYETVDTPAKLAELVRQLGAQKRIAIDTETTSTRPRWAEIVGYSFAWRAGHAVYVPVRAPSGQTQLDPAKTLAALRPILEDDAIQKIGQNLKYDMIVLRNVGVELRNVGFDTMVADYLLAPGQRSHGLDDLAKRYLRHETIKIRDLIGTGKSQKQMDEVAVEIVTPYAAEDALVPWQLSDILAKKLNDEKLDDLFFSLELPLIRVLAEMEFNGIKVDVTRLERLSQQTGQRMQELEREIYQLAGRQFNIESPKQLAKVLFDDLDLPVVKRTKTGASTDASVLSQLAQQHELPATIIEYRQYAKLKNTYMDALPTLVQPHTQRIHTSFKQDVAATGRLSSTEPNLQNIPVRTREGREIRAAFLPGDPTWQLLCADYSQIELRVLAHCSQDRAMMQAFDDGLDIHTQVASEVHAVPLDQVTPEMRRGAKAINFGIIYGQSAFGLAKSLGIDKSQAAAFIDAYFERYPGVDRFMYETLEECRTKGYVETILGRRRAVEGVRDAGAREKSRQRNLPERVAVNTVIQGSAADLIKQAMIQVHEQLITRKFAARMLLQIHDELVFEFPADELDDLSTMVVHEMTSAGSLTVGLPVDVKVGSNWADCEPLTVPM